MPKLKRATIVETDDAAGSVLRHRSLYLYNRLTEGDMSPRTEVACYETMMVSLAGPLAEKRVAGRFNHRGAGYDGTPYLTRGSDYDRVADFVLRLAGTDDGEQRALQRWLERRTDNLLTLRWPCVQAVATALLAHGTLDGPAVRAAILEALSVRLTPAEV